MNIDISMLLVAILNILIIILMTVLGFIGKRLINTNDKQYILMHDIREFIHTIDKRVIILETHRSINRQKIVDKDRKN